MMYVDDVITMNGGETVNYAVASTMDGATVQTRAQSPAFSVTEVDYADGSHIRITRAHWSFRDLTIAELVDRLDDLHAGVVESVRGRLAAV